MKKCLTRLLFVVAFVFACAPACAWADGTQANASSPNAEETSDEAVSAEARENLESSSIDTSKVQLSSEDDAALIDGCAFALGDFSRAQTGTSTPINDQNYGYHFLVGSEDEYLSLIAAKDFVLVYVPESKLEALGMSLEDKNDLANLKAYLFALDTLNANGGDIIEEGGTWYFTSEQEYELNGVVYSFNQELKEGFFYDTIIGKDGSDVAQRGAQNYVEYTHACFANVMMPNEVNIVAEPSSFQKIQNFLGKLNLSPLWVTLKTTFTAIVFIFVLGLLAAYYSLRISPRAQDIADSIFTIPMVLPPTVCGFLLLLLCGKNTAFGRFFIDIGFPLVFSWPATVIAAVVVAFPLMYRSARGAFENLDSNMLDAARTLGWSNGKIFFRLMLPLSWSSIAAGTVLAFARALGEFGATLFLAGNYLGVTRTIPIAIYFEWMNGNTDIALFWTGIIIIFSFIVILFINLWSRHTTRYRRGAIEQ